MRVFLAVLLMALSPLTRAATVDAALITQLQGEVTVESAPGSSRPAVAFLKLTVGEKLRLKAGSRVQLVYFDSARQESWAGAAVVEIGSADGKSATRSPEVKQLPPILVKQLARTPGADEHGRAGMVVMRALPTPAKVAALENQYAEFRKAASPEDSTPEAFYLSGLLELKEAARGQTVLSQLRARQGDPMAQGLVEHFTPLLDALSKAAAQ